MLLWDRNRNCVCHLPALFPFQGFYLSFCSLVRLLCINGDKYWHFICFEIVLWKHTTVLPMWQLYFRMHPRLNYQPCNFTVFLTVPPSSKCIQISKVHLRVIKKYAWLGLLIQSKYRSWLTYNKAIIPHFLVIVWVITWATAALPQGFAGRWEFSGFCGEPGNCQLCCGYCSGVEPVCLSAAAAEKLSQDAVWVQAVSVRVPLVYLGQQTQRVPLEDLKLNGKSGAKCPVREKANTTWGVVIAKVRAWKWR